MPLRPCLEPGCPTLTTGRRCTLHERQQQAAKRAMRPRMWTYAETRRRAKAVADHVLLFGFWCPGWKRPAHRPDQALNPLTADHAVTVASGGAEDGELVVLCRACNSAKGG